MTCSSLLLNLGSAWDLHLAMILWIALRSIVRVEAHSGYDFPWLLCHWVPFWAGAEHQEFTDNFASSFRWYDYLFGADKRYHAYRKRQADENHKKLKNY